MDAKQVCQEKTTCRLCGVGGLEKVLELPPTPPANALAEVQKLPLSPFAYVPTVPKPQASFPLELRLCRECGHVQLGHVVDPEVLYRNYTYTSPLGMQPHWKSYVAAVRERVKLDTGDLVVEIGSNNGDLLRAFRDLAGAGVVGFEPAREIVRKHIADREFQVVTEFFNKTTVESYNLPKAKLVVANNVLAHIDDLDDVVEGVKAILAPDGIFVFEVQYLLDLLENNLWDMIYHEHLDYHAVRPLRNFFGARGLNLFHVEHVTTHGGSIRCYVAGDERATQDSVHEAESAEYHAGLFKPETYWQLDNRIKESATRLHAWFADIRWASLNAGTAQPLIAGYGAPAKATTLLHTCELGREQITYIVDDAPQKQGKLTPGTWIPIVSSDEMLHRPPAFLVVLAWNFFQPITEKVRAAFAAAGKPCPKFVHPLTGEVST